LTASDAQALDRRYLLRRLEEVNDVEVLLLCSFRYRTRESARQFWEKHKQVLEYERAVLSSPQPVVDREAIRTSYEDHLVQLGLLRNVYRPFTGETTKFDDHGRPAGMHRELSDLGRLLLREIAPRSKLDLSDDEGES